MTPRHSCIAAIFVLATLSAAAMPYSASADVSVRSGAGLSQPNKPVLKDSGTQTIDGAGSGSGGGVKQAPFDPAQVCFSNCQAPQQQSGSQKSVSKPILRAVPTGRALVPRQ